ncbi:biopolymer transporter ExbD [Desulfococcaceae bacterium HSG8]|nr:biopolymer transporter ExbD [Desulfococcaceae bacterium HSG8]
MAMGTNGDRLMSDINVTPFVDVMLVLLIIFMVTAPMMTQGVDVTLPETSSGTLPSDEENLVITVNKDNHVYINDYEVPLASLREKLTKVLEGRGENREVYFQADKDISYGIAVHIMSEIKGAGANHLGLVTVPFKEDEKEKLNKG